MTPSESFSIRPDVRFKQYVGACPGCGRVRLQLFVDGPDDDERCVGLECEKCHRQWVLNPDHADFYGEYDDRNPLHPPPPENNPFGGAQYRLGGVGAFLVAAGYIGALLSPDRANATLPWLVPICLGIFPMLLGLHAWIDWRED